VWRVRRGVEDPLACYMTRDSDRTYIIHDTRHTTGHIPSKNIAEEFPNKESIVNAKCDRLRGVVATTYAPMTCLSWRRRASTEGLGQAQGARIMARMYGPVHQCRTLSEDYLEASSSAVRTRPYLTVRSARTVLLADYEPAALVRMNPKSSTAGKWTAGGKSGSDILIQQSQELQRSCPH
jgi:hypothetical protein